MTTVLLTRSENQNDEWKAEFEALGMTVLLQPAIEILPPDSWLAADSAILRIGEFDWVLFSSGNGVRFFMGRLCGCGIKFPDSVKVGVVGGGTDEIFFEYTSRHADALPKISNADGLLEKISNILSGNFNGKKFLLPRGNRGRDILAKGITNAGGVVEEAVVYKSVDCKNADTEILDKMQKNQIDWITATSPAIAESIVNMFGKLLRKTKIISISPLTTAKLNSLGFPPTKEIDKTTIKTLARR
jgi:uroporphyrinogen III methyltransferase/synthase